MDCIFQRSFVLQKPFHSLSQFILTRLGLVRLMASLAQWPSGKAFLYDKKVKFLVITHVRVFSMSKIEPRLRRKKRRKAS